LFFTAEDGAHGRELWTSDGTLAGTELVTDLVPGLPSSHPALLERLGDSQVVFRAQLPDVGLEPFVSDGTAAGTKLLKDAVSGPFGSFPGGFTTTGSRFAWFTALGDGVGAELWRTDGTPAGTTLVADIQPGAGSSSPAGLMSAGGQLLFTADDGLLGRELWSVNSGASVQPKGTSPIPFTASSPGIAS
jgi:ELWxxDGT repeat protein